MADTLDDFTVVSTEWTDVYATTGIAVGTEVSICNKGGYPLLVKEALTKPLDADDNGVLIATYRSGSNNGIVKAGSSGVWIKATKSGCKVNVQEV